MQAVAQLYYSGPGGLGCGTFDEGEQVVCAKIAGAVEGAAKDVIKEMDGYVAQFGVGFGGSKLVCQQNGCCGAGGWPLGWAAA